MFMETRKTSLCISIYFCCYVIVCLSKSNLDCGVLIKSTCNDNETGNWNRKNIGDILKTWIRSIDRIGVMTNTENKAQTSVIRKKMRIDLFENDYFEKEYSQKLTYIGNLDCRNKKSFGPIWKTPTFLAPETSTKNLQFHNGFLYGIEDQNGSLTGRYEWFVKGW